MCDTSDTMCDHYSNPWGEKKSSSFMSWRSLKVGMLFNSENQPPVLRRSTTEQGGVWSSGRVGELRQDLAAQNHNFYFIYFIPSPVASTLYLDYGLWRRQKLAVIQTVRLSVTPPHTSGQTQSLSGEASFHSLTFPSNVFLSMGLYSNKSVKGGE